ncbi:hypothetical protein OUZ56_010331 [Daphnia magna]|uniref:Uncharacterized protein n=1 Tax=Daphnia magna TaxID=35525 RepID=A0ABR0AI82_9CRUS|nr:hypothetical protein OUZ56_010331 [Daphnia magna]
MANTTAKETSHIAKFNGDNWRSYSFGIQMLFDKNRLSSLVDGTNVLPTQVFPSPTGSDVKDIWRYSVSWLR